MKLRHFFFLILMTGMSGIYSQILSDKAFASLITCGPGNDFYTTFGHTALRICDTAQDFDCVFNYGTFDFDTPHFYYKFCRGQLNYCLSISSFEYFIRSYESEGRAIYEQKLKLTPTELQKLMDGLYTNYRPENRYYPYDFFLDNCATRVRDRIESCLEGRSFYRHDWETDPKSYRQLLQPAMSGNLEWWRLGIDLVLGARCDRSLDVYHYMFLPFHLSDQTDSCCFVGSSERLAEEKTMLAPETREPLHKSISPIASGWMLLVFFLAISIYEIKKKKYSLVGKIADIGLFSVTSLISLLIVFLWFLSEHYCTQWNLNLLWANPLFICLLIRFSSRKHIVPAVLSVCCTLCLVLYFLRWPQILHPAVLPLLLTLMLRVSHNAAATRTAC